MRGKGIVGSANPGGARQVTIVSNTNWARLTQPLGATPEPRMRRANLLVSDIDFTGTCGKILWVGSVRIASTAKRACEEMDADLGWSQDCP